jgi:hypothetical protein
MSNAAPRRSPMKFLTVRLNYFRAVFTEFGALQLMKALRMQLIKDAGQISPDDYVFFAEVGL